MKFKTIKAIGLTALFMVLSDTAFAQNYEPLLLLSKSEAKGISQHLGDYKILEKSYSKVKKGADKALEKPIEVPVPVDNGGGYTHEKHKKNYRDMYYAGLTFQITGEKKYAQFVEDMLLGYAKIYPGLPLHPKRKAEQNSGKLFWQGLNDCVWLVHGIQAYDLVKESISDKNREIIEKDVFRSMASFLSESEGGKDTFNKIHNHGTWAVAAVGMTGYVLNDKDMVDRALYGSAKDKKTGFMKQIDLLFSPDGYYSEGPYYQRYALQPFMVFAEAINRNQPEIKIFEYRNQVLKKATNTVLQLTDGNGYFFPINDALKEKNFMTEELVFATNIVFENYNETAILPVVLQQNEVSVTGAGLKAAEALQGMKKQEFVKNPMLIADGPEAYSGGLSIFRMHTKKKDEQLTAIFKYASQGMGHGHFDRLGILLYNNGNEILQDYGAARFLNVESKSGGRYLDENKSWAQQSIAHNTVIVDEKSNFGGDWKVAEKTAPEPIFGDISNPEVIQISSAVEKNAYAGVEMQRTVALIGEETPFILDIYTLKSKESHQYDLNFMFNGHIMETDFKYEPSLTALSPLGKDNGYQHLWNLAESKGNNGISKFTWLNDSRFYTISTITDENSKLFFTRLGANDPNFNLRNESGYLIRNANKKDYTFVSVIEPHGSFDPKLESVQDPHSKVENIQILKQDENYTAISVSLKNKKTYTLLFTNKKSKADAKHKLSANGKTYEWKGNYKLITN
ncbi:alginate lyase family protein [uncultured Flavobacterium sp.]|uniref:heparinase II/III domain-containing protein n=1 Tax=uncultured Flavobacterium sp. TaxID=165435 RepID=UPI0025E7B429|nr:alginate lyase family protein [uncultured Flavobacterium sp.]